MKFISFTNEEKLRANEVSLVDYLHSRGEKLKRVGSTYFVESFNGVSVNNNKWYDHYNKVGGVATSFLKQFYGYSYVEAVVELLGGQNIESLRSTSTNVNKPNCKNISSKNISSKSNYTTPKDIEKDNSKSQPKKSFELPKKARNNDKMIDYLCNKRFIDKDIVNDFIMQGSLYQSEEKNNVIFVGFDENKEAKFGCAKGSYLSQKGTFTQTLTGADCNYSFNYLSKSNSEILFVFEAPIDMLSFITLNKTDWKEFNYIALDGVSEKPLLKFLETNKNIKEIRLSLDNDIAGFEATEKLRDILYEKVYKNIKIIKPVNKDWNEELKELNGVTPKPSVMHPKYEAYLNKIDKLLFFYKDNYKASEERVAMQYSNFVKTYKNSSFDDNEETLEKLVRDIVVLLKKHLKHIGKNVNEEKIFKSFISNYRAYKDKAQLGSKVNELNELMKEFNTYREKATLTEDKKVAFIKNMMQVGSMCIRVDIKLNELHQEEVEKIDETKNFNQAEVCNEQVMNFG